MTMISVFIMILNIRSSPDAGVINILATLPFFMDASISCAALFTDSFEHVPLRSGQEVQPAARILPDSIMQDSGSRTYMTGNWKDGMADNATTSVDNQLMALMLIVAQVGLGGYLAVTGNSMQVAAPAIAYAGSSLVGYFNISDSPVLSAARLNLNSGLLTAALVISMMTGGFSMSGMMLAGALGVDMVSSLTNRNSSVPGDMQSISPILSFFL